VLRGLCPPDSKAANEWDYPAQTKTNEIEHAVDHEKTVNLKQA